MDNNSNIQEVYPKKGATISLVLGIISLIGSTINFWPVSIGGYLLDYYEWQPDVYYSLFIPMAIFGLILGRVGLKSPTKKMAMAGIITSCIGLLVLGLWFWIYWGFTHSNM